MKKRIVMLIVVTMLIVLALGNATAATFTSPIPTPTCSYAEDTMGYEICCMGVSSSSSWMCATPVPEVTPIPEIVPALCVGLPSGYILCY